MTSEEVTRTELRNRLTRLEQEQQAVLEALRASEERYRLLVERSPDAIIIHTNGRFVYANPAALDLYGAASLSDLAGRNVLDFVHPEERETVTRRMSELDEDTARTFRRESRIQRLDGQTVQVEISGARTVYMGQRGALVFLRDISERKKAEAEMERLASFPKLNPNPIVEVDLEGRIHFMNPAAQRLWPDLGQAGIRHPWFSGWDLVVDRLRRQAPDKIVRDLDTRDFSYQQAIYYSAETKRIRVYGTDITERKRAEEAQRENEAFLRRVLDSLFTFAGVLTPDGYLIEANKPALDAAKLKISDVLQKRFDQTYWWSWSPEVQARLLEAMERASRGEPCRFDVVIRVSEEQFIPIDFMLSPMCNDSGRVTHLIPSGVPIVERKRMEEALRQSEERFRTLADATFEGVVITENGRCTDVNDQMARIFGYKPYEMIGMEIAQFIVPEDRAHFLNSIGGGRETLTEHRAARKDGETIVVEALGKTTTYQGRKVGITVVRDVTARNQAQDALRRAKEELEDRVRERTAELSKAISNMQVEIDRRAQAEEELQARSEQLRTLAAMLTMTEQRERKRIAGILHDHVQQLLVGAKFRIAGLERDGHPQVRGVALEVRNLIDETIETARSLTGELSPTILREGGLIPAMGWLVRWMKEKHDLTVELEADECTPPTTEDVTILLFQAVRELLFNVVKHAKTERALVRITYRGGQITIMVIDHGAGFDPDQLWPRGEITSGFGLFSIRERFSLQGGHLEVESARGQGCCITISMPIPQTLASNVAPGTAAVADATKSFGPVAGDEVSSSGVPNRILVLVADDHKVMREGMRKLLQEQADILVVGEAENGQMAVQLARKIRPDVILMDVSMPDINGIQATRIIRNELPQIRIIGLSMFSESEQAAAMFDAGAVNYLSKTSPSDSIIKAIRACACPLGNAILAIPAEQADTKSIADPEKWRALSNTPPPFEA